MKKQYWQCWQYIKNHILGYVYCFIWPILVLIDKIIKNPHSRNSVIICEDFCLDDYIKTKIIAQDEKDPNIKNVLQERTRQIKECLLETKKTIIKCCPTANSILVYDSKGLGQIMHPKNLK